jgi:hypothetical protein
VNVSFRLLDLVHLHSLLLWDEILAATAAVLRDGGREPPHDFTLCVEDVPGFGSETIRLLIDVTGIPFDRITKVQRTYEPSRLIEVAAIAVAGAGLAAPASTRLSMWLFVAAQPTTWSVLLVIVSRLPDALARPTSKRPGSRNGNAFASSKEAAVSFRSASSRRSPDGLGSLISIQERTMTMGRFPISDMLVTVKSREIQRGLLAAMRNDRPAAVRHLLAAAHLELVLVADYREAGDSELALRSHLSAASCFWRAGQVEQAERLLAEIAQAYPDGQAQAQQVREELVRDYPAQAS